MSIAFTDPQIKNVSKDILLLPFYINDSVTGLVAQKAIIVNQTQALLDHDNDFKAFFDFWQATIGHYHAELLLLSGNQRTAYNPADLDAAGDQAGLHFPISPAWVKLAPKYLQSMSGLPSTATGNDTEDTKMNAVTPYIDLIKNGFNDGGTDVSITGITNTQFTVPVGTPPSIGQRIILDGSGKSLFGIVTNVVGTLVDYTYFGGDVGSTIGSGRCRTFHAGFTNLERSHTGAPNYANSVMIYFENQIIATVTDWQNHMLAEKAELDNNGDYAPRKANIQLALTNIANASADIISWSAFPYTSLTGKFVDTGLAVISGRITTRLGQTSVRAAQIITDLGSVSQDSEGVFSGSGVYFELSKTINQRVSRTGSLCAYRENLLMLKAFDKMIDDANAQLAQYQATMFVNKLTADSTAFDNLLPVDSVADLSLGDEIKIMDNLSNVYTRQIAGISGLIVQLDTVLPVALTIANLARVVKLK